MEALRQVQPADHSATEIDARLGSTWIEADAVSEFAGEVLGEEGITCRMFAGLAVRLRTPHEFLQKLCLYTATNLETSHETNHPPLQLTIIASVSIRPAIAAATYARLWLWTAPPSRYGVPSARGQTAFVAQG